ncbi:hypothetical protein GCM10007383_12770 [Arenibacter certesii]|uniref:DUF2141 domain-containing protein n=2 Tax=Arenibacter certesii TaxID=228955 RepID=A0A918IRJ8_9FLAO|nr:hypothetical protein GCM10007383_12770 [Arenibacter certesii]
MSQINLSVEVKGVPSNKGKISVALYTEAENFLKFDKVFRSNSVVAKENTTTVLIDDLPSGNYALAVFHDENGNDELDVNWLGIPKEKVAFSNAKMKLFGPPSYKDCVVFVSRDTILEVWVN